MPLAVAAASLAVLFVSAPVAYSQFRSGLGAPTALLLPESPDPQSDASPRLPELAQTSSSSEPPTTPPGPPPGNSPAGAQDQPTEPSSKAPATNESSPTTEQTRERQRQQAQRDLQTEEKQRLLGIMPQFQTVMGGKAVPLTAGQKWQLASHTAIDPFYIGYAFIIGGGYSELQDSHQGYGWGPGGYFKRVGANYADNIDGALIGNGLLPILLHQDPRYFRLGTGSFGRRFLHAALSTVVCLGDNGHRQANVSNVLGNFVSGAISNAYYPANERGVSLTLENGAEVTALGAVGGQLLEFGPDINRLLHRHRRPAANLNAPTTSSPSPETNP